MTGRRPGAAVATAAAAAAAAALVLSLAGQRGGHPAPRAAGRAPIVVTGEVAPPPPPSTPPPPLPAGPLEVSRGFVVAYVGFVYGRLSAAQLPSVSPYVRHQVERQRPDPPAAVRAAADPRLQSLRVTDAGRGGARAVAVIEDGAAVYQIALELHRRPRGWTITGLSENG